VPIDSASTITLSLRRWFRRNSVISMASEILCSKLISPLPALPLRPRVLLTLRVSSSLFDSETARHRKLPPTTIRRLIVDLHQGGADNLLSSWEK
jgi:hypothetical protein